MSAPSNVIEFISEIRALNSVRSKLLLVRGRLPMSHVALGAVLTEGIAELDGLLLAAVQDEDPNSGLFVALRASQRMEELENRISELENKGESA